MPLSFPTDKLFFASFCGRRLQKQTAAFLATEDFSSKTAVLTGSSAPFIMTFANNAPDIVDERETLPENVPFVAFPAASGSVSTAFVCLTHHSLSTAVTPLFKETHRLLKPNGRIYVLHKTPTPFFHIDDVPELSARFIKKELETAGFRLLRRQGLLFCPFAGKAAAGLDDILFSLKLKTGSFCLFCAQKEALIAQTTENYKSTRITKASVFTSPRT